jgi:hypothetical protein
LRLAASASMRENGVMAAEDSAPRGPLNQSSSDRLQTSASPDTRNDSAWTRGFTSEILLRSSAKPEARMRVKIIWCKP